MQKILSRLAPFLANIFFIGFTIIFLSSSVLAGYDFIRDETIATLAFLGAVYAVCALPYYLLAPLGSIKPTKGLLALSALRTFVSEFRAANSSIEALGAWNKVAHKEKTAFLFIVVKFFFLPLMLNFLFNHLDTLIPSTQNFLAQLQMGASIASYNIFFFPYIISLIFFIDVLYFTFGYIFEHKVLDNEVRSVEPTFFGWAITLACYPPFNAMTGAVLGWYASDHVTLSDPTLTFILNIVGVILLSVYVWASIALGAKCSNLTNRGIVARGPYGVVRHPAYIAKNLAWWITVIPTFNIVAFISMAGWSLIYYLRALTEERHLLRDPDYQAYAQKVKYKFIPGVW